MKALKFLRPGRVAPFTGATWPLPGAWLAAAAPPELCRAGVHALLADVLAIWIAEELWRVELDGGQELAPGIVVAARGRLLDRVEGWNDQTRPRVRTGLHRARRCGDDRPRCRVRRRCHRRR